MPETTRIAAALSDRYVIEREIGAGGMATVYLARDRKHDRDVALKILRADLSAVLGGERFLNEVRITARLDHPHILTLIDSGEADGILYYVLPFVRGESLRTRLEREKQLGIEEALSITRQIASALDYAHHQGVVHRDIKPENILLHEGEAMLADFGIALAVKEAGGNRLTETGLSLGTPQYMSPEQATGDRRLDARSDVYSLAAVLYELLAGEPPVTGPTAQAMIAKLITERPTSLRVVRDTVPVTIDNAVQKALSKVPADRFASAGDFMRALEVRGSLPSASGAPVRVGRGRLPLMLGSAAVLAVAATALFLARPRHHAPVTLASRTQLTFTGQVFQPSVSPDGKQLAFYSRSCSAGDCTWAIEVQDVGGTVTRRVLEHLSAAYGLSWSPDRRNLVAVATIDGHWGTYLVSVLGGTPRYLGPGGASFFAGGDSVILSPSITRPDTVFWFKVQTLDGATRDSVRVSAPIPSNAAAIFVVPGSRLLVAWVLQAGKGLWKVVDRHGVVMDQLLNSCTCGGTASGDALWLARAGNGPTESVVRIALDTTTGRLAKVQDTVYSGAFTGFSVTSDGGSFVVDAGTDDYSVWATETADALRGRFRDAQRVLHASTPVEAQPSPDGARLLFIRMLPSGSGGMERRLSVRPFGGGAETSLNTPAAPLQAFWNDDDHIAMSSQKGHGLQLSLVDLRSNAVTRSLDLPDSTVQDFEGLPDGWGYIPNTDDRVITVRGGQRREERKPDAVGGLIQLVTDPSGAIWASGWNATTYDSLMAIQVPMTGAPWPVWAKLFAERGYVLPMTGGGIMMRVFTTQQSVSLFRVDAPGQIRKLGTIPRPVDEVLLSRDGRHMTVGVRDHHGDAWMSQVVRP